MTTLQIILLCLTLVAIVAFMYFILPRISKGNNQIGKTLRLAIFSFIALYLAYDFYMKAKYGFLLILALGSFAFVVALFSNKKK
jgi:hypothetical protein